MLRGLRHTLADPGCALVCCEIHPQFLPPGVTVDLIEGFMRGLGFKPVEMRPRGGEIHMVAFKSVADSERAYGKKARRDSQWRNSGEARGRR